MAAANEIPCHYFTNDDGSVKVRAIAFDPKTLEEVKKDIEEYKWVEKDFLLASFPKNGESFTTSNLFERTLLNPIIKFW